MSMVRTLELGSGKPPFLGGLRLRLRIRIRIRLTLSFAFNIYVITKTQHTYPQTHLDKPARHTVVRCRVHVRNIHIHHAEGPYARASGVCCL